MLSACKYSANILLTDKNSTKKMNFDLLTFSGKILPFLMVVLAAIETIAQGVHGSIPGVLMFGAATCALVKLLALGSNDVDEA